MERLTGICRSSAFSAADETAQGNLRLAHAIVAAPGFTQAASMWQSVQAKLNTAFV